MESDPNNPRLEEENPTTGPANDLPRGYEEALGGVLLRPYNSNATNVNMHCIKEQTLKKHRRGKSTHLPVVDLSRGFEGATGASVLLLDQPPSHQ